MQDLIGKKVEVITTDILYKGVLIEVGEQEVQLQTETGWTVVPMEIIVDIKALE